MPTSTPSASAPAGPVLEGSYFDGLTSREQPARAGVQGELLVVRTLTLEARFPLSDVRIEPGLPGTRRVLKLPGGARLETGSLEGVAALEQSLRRNPGLRVVARLEGRWPSALLALLGMVLFVALFVRFGLPLVAGLAARLTPVAVMRSLDEQTVRAIDGRYLEPTRLPAARRKSIEAGFQRLAAERGGPYRFRLLFRDGGGSVGANAFALPGGTVFLTDELVRLSRSDAELLGVLAHEVGHVEHRHAMQGVYQGLGLTLLVSVLAGDVTSAASVAAAIPAFLLRSGYSRQAEAQADDDAGRWLMRHYGSTRPLRDILERLSRQDGVRGQSPVLDLLASHPGEAERLAHLKAIEAAGRR